MNKVIELSDSNNTLLVAINDYSSNNSEECIEGSINSDGVTLGYPGKIVSVEDSYSNMKGTKFDENLIEYKKDKCILNKEETIDKYIISGNKHEKKMSIVIDIDGSKYYDGFDTVANNENIALNYLINVNNNSVKSDNILIKTNSNNINDFKKKYNHFYCVKYNGYEVLDYCKKEHINSINIVHYINKNLLLNTKKMLENGVIIFIHENSDNYKEFSTTVKYIKSRGYEIVSVDDLLG